MPTWQFKITEHPHKATVFGQNVQVIKDVQVLRVLTEDGRWLQVGYCGAEPGRPLSLLGQHPQEFIDAATAFVTEQVGSPASTVIAKELAGNEDQSEE